MGTEGPKPWEGCDVEELMKEGGEGRGRDVRREGKREDVSREKRVLIFACNEESRREEKCVGVRRRERQTGAEETTTIRGGVTTGRARRRREGEQEREWRRRVTTRVVSVILQRFRVMLRVEVSSNGRI